MYRYMSVHNSCKMLCSHTNWLNRDPAEACRVNGEAWKNVNLYNENSASYHYTYSHWRMPSAFFPLGTPLAGLARAGTAVGLQCIGSVSGTVPELDQSIHVILIEEARKQLWRPNIE